VIELRLPWPPSMNTYWRAPNTGPLAGRVLLSNAAREYRKEAALWVTNSGKADARARLSVLLTAFPPDKRKRDLDNLLKPLLDTLQHCGIIADDGQIDDLRITRAKIAPDGVIAVQITELAPA
jgi:crossover junction endodeoxyribonuclease RusA